MKKTLPILAISLLLCAIAYSCTLYHTIYCGKLKDRLLFVPQRVARGDTMLLYSNRGNSLNYVVARTELITEEESFESNCDCVCWDNFVLELTTDARKTLIYKFEHNYRDRYWEEAVDVCLSVNNCSYSFSYTVKNDRELNIISTTLLDSLMVNKICYRDVVELKDSVQTVHVAKDYGIVQIIESDSTAWTLNKWEN